VTHAFWQFWKTMNDEQMNDELGDVVHRPSLSPHPFGRKNERRNAYKNTRR
jgi:hypothetical protein